MITDHHIVADDASLHHKQKLVRIVQRAHVVTWFHRFHIQQGDGLTSLSLSPTPARPRLSWYTSCLTY